MARLSLLWVRPELRKGEDPGPGLWPGGWREWGFAPLGWLGAQLPCSLGKEGGWPFCPLLSPAWPPSGSCAVAAWALPGPWGSRQRPGGPGSSQGRPGPGIPFRGGPLEPAPKCVPPGAPASAYCPLAQRSETRLLWGVWSHKAVSLAPRGQVGGTGGCGPRDGVLLRVTPISASE